MSCIALNSRVFNAAGGLVVLNGHSSLEGRTCIRSPLWLPKASLPFTTQYWEHFQLLNLEPGLIYIVGAGGFCSWSLHCFPASS